MSRSRGKTPDLGLWVAAWVGLAVVSTTMTLAGEEPNERGPSPSASSAKPETDQFLLLTDGNLIRGVIGREPGFYTVRRKIGVLRYPERKVERAFDSVQAAYRYRLQRIPEDDPAERLRLARWCLTHHLDPEAMALLGQVVELSPNHAQARLMLAGLRQTEANRMARAESKVDSGVRQASAMNVSEDNPRALDSAVLAGAGRRMGISGLPVIFDLPPATAVMRAQQFKQYVHPVLQAYCVRCHNADYPGRFQLVPTRTSRQRTPDALRANLDATLRLIDPDNLSRSEILTTVLLPHGASVNRRPILLFSGSNDRAYQIISAWVNSLHAPGQQEARSEPGMSEGEDDEPFGAGRRRSGTELIDPYARGMRPTGPGALPGKEQANVPNSGGPSYRFVEGRGMLPEDPNQVDPREFPLPYMLGGPKPKVPGAANPKRPDRMLPSTVPAQGVRARNPQGAGVPAPAIDDDVPPLPDTPPVRTSGKTPAKKSKPVSIDPKLLQKLLQGNANRQSGS